MTNPRRVGVSGCATGIGAAIRARLSSGGDEIIGIDLKDAEVIADLSSAEGREAAVRETLERSDGRLDGLVLCAGLGGHIDDTVSVAEVNYFGVVELLDGLLPALEKGRDASAVAICSNSAQLAPQIAEWPLTEAMLAGDETRVRELATGESGQLVYIASKNAVGRAVRRRVQAWADAGVRLNAVAPGTTDTPLVRSALELPDGQAIRNFPVPLGRWARPEDIASVVAFLMGPDASFVHGAIWYVDGGSDALTRPERF